jgi:hypothetical protein
MFFNLSSPLSFHRSALRMVIYFKYDIRRLYIKNSFFGKEKIDCRKSPHQIEAGAKPFSPPQTGR